MRIFNYVLAMGLILSSCNDSFLDKKPIDQETPESFFQSYDNCKTYAWQFYSWYKGYGENMNNIFEINTDNGFYGYPNNENIYSWDKVTTDSYVSTGSQGWDYSNIRTIQVMLDYLEYSKLSESDKNHWKSVCYFFKSQEYFRLLSRFGQAIWVDKVLSENDDDILYGPAIGRIELADKIFDMLTFAHDNIKINGDGDNTINRNVVNALISRFGLFEGTWQKYHKTPNGNSKKYLDFSYKASSELIQMIPEIHSNYNDIFNSYDLSNIKGILLYKRYIPTKTHTLVRYIRSSSSSQEASSDLVQSYLCNDGRPIWNSNVYEGDKETGNDIMNIEFRNRDYRLYYTICPPFRVNTYKPATKWPEEIDKIIRTDNILDSEYIDLMNNISPNNKFLPILQFGRNIVREIPHFEGRYSIEQGYNISRGGYFIWKYYVPEDQTANCDTDAPIFRMGEVLVNHAEVAWELGIFNQDIADITINKLRKRANVAKMIVADIDANFDPKRDKGGYVQSFDDDVKGPDDYEVDPVLWEIRRERRVELAFEIFRFDDLRRWAKGHYTNKIMYGAFVRKADYENERYVSKVDFSKFDLKLEDPTKEEGRIALFGKPTPGWTNKYYLYPIPINDLSLNENLVQNPGYK